MSDINIQVGIGLRDFFIITLVSFFILFSYTIYNNYHYVDADIAVIEQLREDVAKVGRDDDEHVLGYAAIMNGYIVRMQTLDKGFFGFLVPNQWRDVRTINLFRPFRDNNFRDNNFPGNLESET